MHIDWLRAQTAAFAAAAAELDLAEQVTTCPDWSVRMLVAHIGHAHRQAANIVRTGEPEQFRDPRTADIPRDWDLWLREGADDLVDAVTEAGNRHVWAFVGTRPAPFWLRRMLHDTAVHAVDAAITAGSVYRIPPETAIDGVDEALEVITAPGAEAIKADFVNLRGTGQTLRLCSDEGVSWLVTRTPQGPKLRRERTEADVTVTASAQDLMLFCYGRLDMDHVAVRGDTDVLAHWVANTAL